DALRVVGTSAADTLAVTATTVSWNGSQTVNYAGVEALALDAADGDDTLTVSSTAAIGVTLDGQGGSDTYTVSFGALAGSVIVGDSGSDGDDQLTTDGTAAAQTLTVTATAVVWNVVEAVGYAGVEGLTVNGGAGGDTLQVLSTSAATPVTVNGEGGD